MTRNQCSISAPPAKVFAILADASHYDRWVVGAKEVRAADPSWPDQGARLYHTIGIGPLQLKDNTEVLEVDAPRRLCLKARGRPFGTARIEFNLASEGSGTRLTMDEVLVAPPALALLDALLGPAVRVRNTETLRRLSALATSDARDT